MEALLPVYHVALQMWNMQVVPKSNLEAAIGAWQAAAKQIATR